MDLFMEKASWNRLCVEWFLYGKGLFVKGIIYGKGSLQTAVFMEKASWNRLFVEWFPYGKGLFVKGFPS